MPRKDNICFEVSIILKPLAVSSSWSVSYPHRARIVRFQRVKRGRHVEYGPSGLSHFRYVRSTSQVEVPCWIFCNCSSIMACKLECSSRAGRCRQAETSDPVRWKSVLVHDKFTMHRWNWRLRRTTWLQWQIWRELHSVLQIYIWVSSYQWLDKKDLSIKQG